MALTNPLDKTKIGLILKRENRERRGRGREEEDEGEKFKQSQIKVRKLTLIMDSMRFGIDLWFCMIIILPKTRVLLRFHPNPIIMESKVDKTLNSTRSI